MWTKLLLEAGGCNLMFLPEAAGGGQKSCRRLLPSMFKTQQQTHGVTIPSISSPCPPMSKQAKQEHIQHRNQTLKCTPPHMHDNALD